MISFYLVNINEVRCFEGCSSINNLISAKQWQRYIVVRCADEAKGYNAISHRYQSHVYLLKRIYNINVMEI